MTAVLTRSNLTSNDMQYVVEESRDLAAELQQVVQGEVRFDGYSRMLYSTDASLYQIQPVGVVIPKSEEDVQATIEIAAKRKIPILPRGSGSSLAGQAVGAAIVIDFSKYMGDLINIDTEARTVTVQPGMTITPLNRALGKHGLMLGPDPASADRATVGGTIGNNATGSHSILYGMMADHVVSAKVFLADGSRANLSPLDAEALAAKARGSSLEASIYQRLPLLINGVMDEIVTRWPKHWRRASGYNLDRLAAALLPADQRSRLSFDTRFRPAVCNPERIDRFNLAQLLTGSEGTLAVMTEVTVGLVPKPAKTALAVIHFDDVVEACATVPDVLETEPSASELMDKQMMDLARAQPEWAKRLNFVVGDPAAILLTEYYGTSDEELNAKLEHLEQHLLARGYRGVVLRVITPSQQNDVWTVRKAGLNILMSRRSDYKPIPGIEDVTIPQEYLAEYMRQVFAFCDGLGDIPGVAVYAHASAGCLHVRPLVNVKTARGVELMQILGDYACDLAVKYSGAMSGEHGDGLARSALNPKLFGPELYAALQEVKRTFDPENLLNPGKIVNAPPLTENLRYGKDYQTIELKTVFDWSDDGGFASAVEMCNGAGVCRKLGAGSMCPSFMATKDEHDTTRARANSLRNAMAGRIPQEELFSDGMYGVMDLCLGCKACKSECPSAVDMAKIKSEYLVHYYKENGLPLFNRMMGLLPTINELLYKFTPFLTPVVNWTLKSPIAKQVFAKIGVHPARDLPAYAPETFATWFGKRGKQVSASTAPNGPVLLFHDTWVNFNETSIGKAMVEVLEAAGYAVYLAEDRKCCGRPLITGGQADQAKPWIDHNITLLAPYAQAGIPIVGIEPSCILTIRDEYRTLASDRKRAELVASKTLTFDEFVAQAAAAGRFNPPTRQEPRKAMLHGHCHHKALVGNESTVAALKAVGYTVETIPSGCCGMAGDFGYEKDHYEISQRIGEDRLFPAVRAAAADTVIVASGTSCRHQIDHFTGKLPVHLAEALASTLTTHHQ